MMDKAKRDSRDVIFADRAERIQPSQTLAITDMVARLRRSGKEVLALGAGEPDFDTPVPIKDAARQAIDAGYTKYTTTSGIIELKEAVCNKYRVERGARYSPDEVLISNGAKHALVNAILALCQAGDEIIIPAPYWTSYVEMARFVGAEPVILPTEESTGFKITPEQLEAAATGKTKLLLLNSPCNPTGAVYSQAELAELASVIERTGIYVLFDEIYEKILYDGAQHASLTGYPGLRDRLIIVNGVSKAYAMTGWRIGYLLAPPPVVAACGKIQGHTTSNPCSISQHASVAALTAGDGIIAPMLAAFAERRKFVVDAVDKMPRLSCLTPPGAFYLFINVADCMGGRVDGRLIDSPMALCAYLLESAGVAIVPGEAFGSDRHVRLSYAASMDTLEEALRRVEKAVAGLDR